MRLAGKKALVVGFRRSGAAAARLLAARGAAVTVTDTAGPETFAAEMKALEGLAVSYVLGGHRKADFDSARLVVVSPGVPADLPLIAQARLRGAEVIGELELGARFVKGRLLAVSGTNGKSTVSELAGLMLRKAGMEVFVGGNTGVALCEAAVSGRKYDAVVCEVSSFQLETVTSFRPAVAVMLNLTPDHLDRHPSLERYVAAKKRLFAFMKRGDAAVLNADDGTVKNIVDKKSIKKYYFSSLEALRSGAWAEAAGFAMRSGRGKPLYFDVSSPSLKGSHNRENAMAAALGATLMGAGPDAVRAALAEFRGLAHRIEFVRSVAGVDYVDDSKATNEAAAVKALRTIPSRIVLIAGGKDKGFDFPLLAEAARKKVVYAVLIGETARKLSEALGGVCPVAIAGGMDEAVDEAALRAEPGMTVLLSPGCSSFDMFESFEDRGKRFKEAVLRIEGEQSPAESRSAGWLHAE